jgi:hypothetical protein
MVSMVLHGDRIDLHPADRVGRRLLGIGRRVAVPVVAMLASGLGHIHL